MYLINTLQLSSVYQQLSLSGTIASSIDTLAWSELLCRMLEKWLHWNGKRPVYAGGFFGEQLSCRLEMACMKNLV